MESGADLALKCGSGAVVGTPVVGTAVVGTAAASQGSPPDVRHDVSGGPVRNTPQVTKSEPARNPSLSSSWAEGAKALWALN